MEYFENNFTAPPNSDKIVMWRFLRNRRLILRLHRPTIFRTISTHILGASCGHLIDSVIFLLLFSVLLLFYGLTPEIKMDCLIDWLSQKWESYELQILYIRTFTGSVETKPH